MYTAYFFLFLYLHLGRKWIYFCKPSSDAYFDFNYKFFWFGLVFFFSMKIQIRKCNTRGRHSPLAQYYTIASFK